LQTQPICTIPVRLRVRRLDMDQPATILIIKPSSLGDVATCLPLLADLKAQFPKAKIDWLVSPAFDALVRHHPDLNACIHFDRSALAGWCWKPSSTRTLSHLIHMIRQAHYDVVIDAQGLLRSATLAWASGATMRIGPGDAREGAKFLYTHRVDTHRQTQLAVDRMRHLQTPLAPLRDRVEFKLRADPDAASRVHSLLGNSQPFVALLPAARWSAKIWSIDGYARLGRRIANAGLGVALIGTPAEANMCTRLADQIGAGAKSWAGKTSIAEMIALLDFATAVVGNDTGPLHVAAALQRPLIGLYGPTDEKSVGPWGQLDHVLRFAPVDDYRQTHSIHESDNLRRLPVEQVWRKLEELLNASHAKKPA